MDTSLPSPPFVEVPGVHNFRGIGGDHAGPGLVFRSADPSKATRAGLEKMSQDLGIRVIFDLRSTPEIKRDGPEWAGVAPEDIDIFQPYGIKREWVPVFAEKDYGPDQVALRYKEYTRAGSDGFVKAYHDILLNAPQAYGKILRHLAQDKPSAPSDEISNEYALTDLGLAPLRALFIERLLKNPALEGNAEGVSNMVSSKPENMRATQEMIERDFGGAQAYMTKYCGLSDDEVERVRKNITDGAIANL
ncbi:hypothetical protein KC340_g13514 [Hortaea werneckii]|nr:hypothetical protein KC342_g13823 [Hortaea werneckii]KAI7069451.1 hypothetical protein KC339_g14833 [Hortaea werneckii]KAI7227283.1 hypothetical protein KC365_g8977 [Hortaea werneckii]KAI7300054.1 hypothetical protein KC340_g13514 [Hortaea werneckii]KAI7387115.1 hypothetical protein KC328_g9604 [Hortaea werneckii]